MIKTLRITSVVAAILAGIFFVFPVVFGVRGDEQMEAFLGSAGVVEQFEKTRGSQTRQSQSRQSPLVKQAETFALYLNPVKPTTPNTSIRSKATVIAREPAVTPRFPVIGTSVCESRPEMSLALIDEPGKGLRWVRQSAKVGHLKIEQIKDGVVVVRGAKGTFDLVVQQKPEKNFLEEAPPVSAVTTGQTGSRPVLPALNRTSSGPTATRPATQSRPPQPVRSPEEDARLQELVSRLKDLRRGYDSDKTDSGPSDDERAALTEKLISNFRASRVSDEEAKRLDNFGKKLEDIQDDPNRSLPGASKGETEARPRKPQVPAGK